MAYLFRNNVSTTINDSNGVGTGDTVITVTDGSIFPSPSLGTVRATLVQLDSSGNEQAVEIVTITGVSSNDLTVTRAQESTTALTLSNGDLVEMRLTRSIMESLQRIDENAQTGTSYTLILSDELKLVTMENGSANTLTVPPNSTAPFPIGAQVIVSQLGAGQTTITEGAGVTIRTPSTLLLRAQYSSVSLIKIATDEWLLAGDTE